MAKWNTVKAVALFVAFLLSNLALFGCSPQKSAQKNEIEIIPREEIPAYKQETTKKAEDAIYLLLYSYSEYNNQKITDESKTNMRRLAQSAAAETSGIINEEDYLLIFDAITDNSGKIVEGVSQIRTKGILDGISTLKPIYKDISSLGGKELVGEIVYSISMCTLDIKYERQMEAYEKYGESYILDKANEYLRAKEVLTDEIGISNINALIEYAFVYVELFVGGAFEDGIMSDFSDEELLIFVRLLELEKITVSEKGWTMLFAIYGEGAVKNISESFFNRVMFSASQNGDVSELARSTSELIPIFSILQDRLTTEDIALLRGGETDKALANALAKFNDEEWELFDNAMPKDFDYDKYVDLAKKYYGKDFESYLISYKTADIDKLKASQGTEQFYKTLKEYVAGICPAFSYGMDF